MSFDQNVGYINAKYCLKTITEADKHLCCSGHVYVHSSRHVQNAAGPSSFSGIQENRNGVDSVPIKTVPLEQ